LVACSSMVMRIRARYQHLLVRISSARRGTIDAFARKSKLRMQATERHGHRARPRPRYVPLLRRSLSTSGQKGTGHLGSILRNPIPEQGCMTGPSRMAASFLNACVLSKVVRDGCLSISSVLHGCRGRRLHCFKKASSSDA
jgi:hypothetical protein